MKNIIYLLGAYLLLMACNAQYVNKSFQKQMKESFLYDFKMTYFKKLLREGFNHSDGIKNVLASDRSGYGESILVLEDYKIIDSLVKIDNEIMVHDSLNSIGRVAEGAQGKRIFDYALNKYQSKWLDNIAKVRYQYYKRSQKH